MVPMVAKTASAVRPAGQPVRRGRGCRSPTLRVGAERDALVMQWQHLPAWAAKKLWRLEAVKRFGFKDAVQAGFLGLIRAAEIWDRARGIKFKTYASRAILNTILTAV